MKKRIASCKKVGGEKKHKGHKREQDFNKQYNPENNEKKILFIANSHTICDKLTEKLNLQTTSFNTSNKRGNNIQFTLGVIPELKDVTAETLNSDKELVRSIFNKYIIVVNLLTYWFIKIMRKKNGYFSKWMIL